MSSLIYISLFAIFYCLLSWRRPDWALMFLLGTLPVYQIRFSVLHIPSTFLEAMILIIFIVWVIKNYKQIIDNIKLRIKNGLEIRNWKLEINQRYPFDIEIALLLIVSWVAIFVAGAGSSAFGVWKAYFFEPVLVYILIMNIFDNNANDANDLRMTRINLEKILWPLFVSAFAVSAVAIFQKFSGVFIAPQFWPRVTGPFAYPNALGLFLGPIVMLMAAHFINQISNLKSQITNNIKYQISNIQYLKLFFVLLTLFLSLLAIFFASSEGAMIGIAVALVVLGVYFITIRFKLKYFLFILISLIFLFAFLSPLFFLKIVPEYKYFNFNNPVLNYISDKAMLKDFSGEVRKQQWRETWQLLTASPKNFIFGAGLSNYQTSVKLYHQEGIFFNAERDPRFRNEIVWGGPEYKAKHWRPAEIYFYPHNIILNLWVELGLAGVLLFIWIVAKTLFLISNFQSRKGPEVPTGLYGFPISKQFPISNFQFLNIGLLGAIIVIVVHGIVDVPYFKNDLAVMFWVLLAMLGILNLNNKKNG